MNLEASMAAKFALNCQDPNIVLDMRKLNARPKSDIFDQIWAMMATIMDGSVSDRRHGKLLYIPFVLMYLYMHLLV